MFFPKKTKYKKSFLLLKKGLENRTKKINFGSYGIKAIDAGFIKSSHIEMIRRVISKKVKKIGSHWIRIFPFISKTKKPLAVRMGKGKGNHFCWVFFVRKGRVLFEIEGLSLREVRDIVFLCNQKLPIKVKILKKI
jgi:large subunit ribosomal protein L16